ncbi:hypothetical protein A3Q56_03224 [Intoshia linei]|uniref:Uncharacterized protein n=1 Tax=Intoshia linei TaxID=1819745 RepID=A0A177B5P6_9BILA|nr:hypothetical protein A3Q56_03224 [Intoshia linei]
MSEYEGVFKILLNNLIDETVKSIIPILAANLNEDYVIDQSKRNESENLYPQSPQEIFTIQTQVHMMYRRVIDNYIEDFISNEFSQVILKFSRDLFRNQLCKNTFNLIIDEWISIQLKNYINDIIIQNISVKVYDLFIRRAFTFEQYIDDALFEVCWNSLNYFGKKKIRHLRRHIEYDKRSAKGPVNRIMDNLLMFCLNRLNRPNYSRHILQLHGTIDDVHLHEIGEIILDTTISNILICNFQSLESNQLALDVIKDNNVIKYDNFPNKLIKKNIDKSQLDQIYINFFKTKNLLKMIPNFDVNAIQQEFNHVVPQNINTEPVVTDEMIAELEAEINAHVNYVQSQGRHSYFNYMPMR